MHCDRSLILGKRDPGCGIIKISLKLNIYMCFSWPVHSFLQHFISERMDCSCLLWCSLSSLICRWKGLSFGCCSSIKNIAVSLFFLSENFSGHSDSLLTAKVTHYKSSSSVIIGFFNSG